MPFKICQAVCTSGGCEEANKGLGIRSVITLLLKWDDYTFTQWLIWVGFWWHQQRFILNRSLVSQWNTEVCGIKWYTTDTGLTSSAVDLFSLPDILHYPNIILLWSHCCWNVLAYFRSLALKIAATLCLRGNRNKELFFSGALIAAFCLCLYELLSNLKITCVCWKPMCCYSKTLHNRSLPT